MGARVEGEAACLSAEVAVEGGADEPRADVPAVLWWRPSPVATAKRELVAEQQLHDAIRDEQLGAARSDSGL